MDKKEMDDLLNPNQVNSKSGKHLPKRKSNHLAIIGAVVGLILVALFVVRPALLGYGVYQEAQSSNLSVQDYTQNMQQLNHDLDVAKANLSSYSTFTGALLTQVDQKNTDLTECKVQLERIKIDVEQAQKQVADKEKEVTDFQGKMQQTIDQQVSDKTSTLEQEKTTCQDGLTKKETEVSGVQAKYDQLVKNTAKSICCKAKVDNPQINFYDVVDNKVTCLEQGTNQLNC